MAIKDEQVRIKAPTRVETGFTTINGLFTRMVEWLENLYFQEETSGSFFFETSQKIMYNTKENKIIKIRKKYISILFVFNINIIDKWKFTNLKL